MEMSVIDKASILALLHRHRLQLDAYGVSRIGLFGSYVRGTQNLDSDIDILVHFRRGSKTLRNLVGLADFLEGILHTRVDLVTAESLSPFFGHHILNEVEYAALVA